VVEERGVYQCVWGGGEQERIPKEGLIRLAERNREIKDNDEQPCREVWGLKFKLWGLLC